MNQQPPNDKIKMAIKAFKFGGYSPKDDSYEDSAGIKAKKRNESLPHRIKEKIGNIIEFFLLKKIFITLLSCYVFIIYPFSKIDLTILQKDTFVSKFFIFPWSQYFDLIDTEIRVIGGYLIAVVVTNFVTTKLNNEKD